MFLDIILLSFLVAFIRGGRIKEVPTFQKLTLLFISIGLQLLSMFLPQFGGVFVSIAYIFTLLFFFFNREFEDIRIFLIGWFLNALVIWTNFGKMPIDLELAKRLPYSVEGIVNGTDFKHAVLSEATQLPFLSDIMYMPYPVARVISIGDIFIMLAAFLLVQRIMNKPISLIRLREGKSYVAKQ